MRLKTAPIPVGNIPAMLAQSRQEAVAAQHQQEQDASRFQHVTRGRRADLDNIFFRSAHEANFARWLNYQIAHKMGGVTAWEYEPYEFKFPVERGVRFYKPDFKVYFGCGAYEWRECKGWMTSKSKTQLKRMAKYFPNEVIEVIDSQQMRALSALWGKVIAGWE